ncbi:MAG TPA: hypothetical protein VLG10_14440 [Methylomirabilota bacterium]|nr:hypothetical protein [Methylomirabilota bacterium]
MSGVPRRTVVFLALAVAAWVGWEAFIHLSAPGRIDDALEEALRREASVNIAVTLPFAPEDFHIRLFQGYGVVRGVRGTTVLIDRVQTDDVWRIARNYWVRRIASQGG